MNCPVCGQEVKTADAYCATCGHPLAYLHSVAPKAEAAPTSENLPTSALEQGQAAAVADTGDADTQTLAQKIQADAIPVRPPSASEAPAGVPTTTLQQNAPPGPSIVATESGPTATEPPPLATKATQGTPKKPWSAYRKFKFALYCLCMVFLVPLTVLFVLLALHSFFEYHGGYGIVLSDFIQTCALRLLVLTTVIHFALRDRED